MSLYLTIYLILFFGWFLTIKIKSERTKNAIYLFDIILLWLLLSLRYGQGTDYFAYEQIFSSIDSVAIAILNPEGIHSEVGFRVLCALFGENYILFVATVSTFEIYMIHRTITRYSKDRIFSLLILYPTYYLTYFFSALRQGMVFALFAGVMIECLEKKKWWKYLFWCIVASLLHKVSLLYLILPIVMNLRIFSSRSMILIPLVSLFIGVMLSLVGIDFLTKIPYIGSSLMSYMSGDISIFGLMERCISYVVLLVLYLQSIKESENPTTRLLMIIYTVGISFYLALFRFPTISARGAMLFKGVEIVLATRLLHFKTKFRQIFSVYFIALSLLITCKNLQSYIHQGNYNSGVSFINYPYISVFDKEQIWEYREYDRYFLALKELREEQSFNIGK